MLNKTIKSISLPQTLSGPLLSFESRQALAEIGKNIKIARLRRNDTEQIACTRVGVSRSTWRKLEKGDPSVSLGLFIEALVIYGFGKQLFDLASPDEDSHGKMLESVSRRKRARSK